LLLIGDRAIHPPRGRWAVVWDLGEEWTSWTGLPFVFALWAVRRGMNAGDLDVRLGAVRDAGLADVAAIAAAEGPPVGFTIEECRRYLTVNLHYRLGDRERQGMELFRQKAEALGLLAAGKGAVALRVKGR
jgi:chorismate dehydratase